MTLVSFAQNGEDIVLGRGLTADRGFYVDIGAYDPDVESVTKLFYERGWHGINVDPVAAFIDRFDVERPRDINVCAAISSHDGEQQLWVSPGELPGHSTLDRSIAEAHDADGIAFSSQTVTAMTLDTMLNKFLPPGQLVDFLKIDVEGAEATVLATWNPDRVRPRVVVVESMTPYVVGSTHERWEPAVLDAGYRLVLFDGLNRYYVRSDEPELAQALSAPANILDNYETAASRRLRELVSRFESELRETRSWATSLSERVVWLEQRLAATDQPSTAQTRGGPP
jgi:FkbM family methyltransferase